MHHIAFYYIWHFGQNLPHQNDEFTGWSLSKQLVGDKSTGWSLSKLPVEVRFVTGWGRFVTGLYNVKWDRSLTSQTPQPVTFYIVWTSHNRLQTAPQPVANLTSTGRLERDQPVDLSPTGWLERDQPVDLSFWCGWFYPKCQIKHATSFSGTNSVLLSDHRWRRLHLYVLFYSHHYIAFTFLSYHQTCRNKNSRFSHQWKNICRLIRKKSKLFVKTFQNFLCNDSLSICV